MNKSAKEIVRLFEESVVHTVDGDYLINFEYGEYVDGAYYWNSSKVTLNELICEFLNRIAVVSEELNNEISYLESLVDERSN